MDNERFDAGADDALPPPPPPEPDATAPSEETADPETEAFDPDSFDAPTQALTPVAATPAAEPAVVAEADEPGEANDNDEPEEKRRMGRGGKVAIALVSLLVLLGAGYAGTAWYVKDKIPNNTFVDGVAIGGLTTEEATAKIDSELASRADDTVTVSAHELSTELTAGELGLSVDAAATVAPMVGFSLNPTDLWDHFSGLGNVDPVAQMDKAAAESALVSVLTSLEVEPVEGAIVLDGGEAVVTDAVEAIRVDVPASIEVIASQWLDADGPIELTTVTKEPDISAADLETAMTTIVEPLLSSAVTVSDGETSAELAAADLTLASELVPENGALTLKVHGDILHELLRERDSGFEAHGENARIVIRNGSPTIIPSTMGMTIDDDQLAAAVASAAVSTDARTAEIELLEADPEFSTEDAEALGVKEQVAIFSTPVTSDNVRTKNLINGSEKITNTLLKPGETFSLINALGPITLDRGFVENGVVENGFMTTALGGGLSQVSATTYNAAYLAGLDIVTHKPHSRYFSRYPEGRESTIWAPDLDMKFKNSTPYGVLVEAWVADGKQWVRLWSTEYYDVEFDQSGRYNIQQPGVQYNSNPRCVPERAGQPGFSVDGWRKRYVDGALDDTYNWSWTYTPWHEVRCGTQAEWEARQNAENSEGDD